VILPSDPPIEELCKRFTVWMAAEGEKMGLDEAVAKAYELANPLGMSADGLQRYWRKVRMAA